MRKLLLVVVSTLALGACSTTVFEKGGAGSGSVAEKWHHNWVFDLYEGSAPVNLDEMCDGKDWQQVQIEESFLNGLATMIASPIWFPDTVTVTCKAAK